MPQLKLQLWTVQSVSGSSTAFGGRSAGFSAPRCTAECLSSMQSLAPFRPAGWLQMQKTSLAPEKLCAARNGGKLQNKEANSELYC